MSRRAQQRNPARPSEPSSVRKYSVFQFNQSRHTTPCMVVDRETRDCLIAYHGAKVLSKWQIVLAKPLPLKLRDASSNIRENTILAAASGSKYHRALIEEAWG